MTAVRTMATTIMNGTAEAGGGRPLPDGVRETMERAFRADLSAVRIHTGREADRTARALGAEAFACGSAVFFREGAYRPHTRAGLGLLAHEIAHVVQQARGGLGGTPGAVSRPGDRGEIDADRQAARVLRGEPADHPPVVVTAGPARLVQRHVSYEHRILGDGPTDDLVAAVLRSERGRAFLKDQIALLGTWASDPYSVTEKDLDRVCPGIQTFRIGPDRVLVTYGELNALPDYLPDAASYETVGGKTLVPILQVIRQEGYNALSVLRNGSDPYLRFADSLVNPRIPSPIYTIREILAFDSFTFGRGIDGKDHYSGILARNACHFAPYTWYRWRVFHKLARDYAGLAHTTKNKEFEQTAWMYHGYADHFLQDSFAAGHLINKTLVMQWFVEWAEKRNQSITDLDVIKDMSVALQPHLSAGWLYDPDDPGPSGDPQTAQEAKSVVARFLDGNVIRDRSSDDFGVYQKYLTFVTSAAANLAAVDLHNHYNDKSLWVGSVARPAPYEVWGDLTLLNGTDRADGVRATSEAAQLSQRSLRDILRTGNTSITMKQIHSHFPTRAGTGKGEVQSLRTWNENNRSFAEKTFESLMPRLQKWLTDISAPRLGIVSEDQRLGGIWSQQLKDQSFGSPDVLLTGGRVFAGANGYVAELEPGTGKVKQLQLLPSSLGQGDYTTRLATDGQYLYAGIHGYVYAAPLDDLTARPWPACPVGGVGIFAKVNVLVIGGRLFAGSAGIIYEFDTRTGKPKHERRLDPVLTTSEVRLAGDGARLYAGLPQAVFALTLGDWSKVLWSRRLGNTDGFANTEVLFAGDRLYAGLHGWVYAFEPGTGRITRERSLTDVVSGTEVDTRLVADDERLYAGYNGSAYAVRLSDWQKEWQLKAGTKEDYGRVDVFLAGNRLHVGSMGYVYDVTAKTGTTRSSELLTFFNPLGLSHPTALAGDGRNLYAGVHGYVYKLLAGDSWMAGRVDHNWYDGRWHGWTPDFDGAPPMQDITACMGRHLEVFGIGQDGAVYHNWFDGRWHRWERNFQGAPPMRSIAAVNGPTRMEVRGIGLDDSLYWNHFDGSWHRWVKDPALGRVRQVDCVRHGDRVYIFVLTVGGKLWYDVNTGKWSGWSSDLDPGVALNTVTALVGPSNLELFGITVEDRLLQNWCDDGKWAHWKYPQAPKMRAITGVMGRTNLEVFAIGTAGVLYHNWFGGSWHEWEAGFHGAPPRVRAVSGVMGDHVEVFLIGLDGTLYHNWYDRDWHVWEKNFDRLRQQVRAVAGVKGESHVEVFALASGVDR